MESYKDVPGYEGLYAIAPDGTIKNKRTGRVLKAYVDRGYAIIRLSKNNKKKTHGVKSLLKLAFGE